MSNYDRILSEFRKLGYNENSYLDQNEVTRALDAIASQNAGFSQFDRSIAEELWEHCETDPTRGVRLFNYVNSLVEAEDILRRQVEDTERNLRMEQNPSQRTELQTEYNQIINDHRIISTPFSLPQLRQAGTMDTSGLLLNRGSNFHERSGESGIFGYEPNTKEESSKDLKLVLFVAVGAFFLELILMFHKHHFLSLLAIFGVLSIFFLNYFDRNYMKFLLILLGVSVILDVAWLGVNAREYWNPDIETQHSTLHSTFLAFIFILVIVMMAVKILIGGVLFKYRDNSENLRKNVSAFGYRMKLDGRPTYNPFTPLFRSAPVQF